MIKMISTDLKSQLKNIGIILAETKYFAMVLLTCMLLLLKSTAAIAGTAENMDKVIRYLSSGNYVQAVKYNNRLPENAEVEACVKNMSASQKKAFLKVVKKYPVNRGKGDQVILGGYWLTDLDRDNTAELIIKVGICSASGWSYFFYRFDNGKVKLFGSFKGVNYYLCQSPGKSGVVFVGVVTGMEWGRFFYTHNNKLRNYLIYSIERSNIGLRNILNSHISYEGTKWKLNLGDLK